MKGKDMAIIKYRTDRYSNKIDPVEINRETDKCIYFVDFGGNEIRQLKESDYVSYHDSWNEARAHLVARTEKRIKHAKKTLEIEEKALQTILSMKPE